MELRLDPVQSRSRPLTSYEHVLADELENVFRSGAHDLPGVVARLNETGVRPPDGADWTEASFTAEMARLGALE
ncbi:recombinase-like helix-turn-helix domain-containing protein [Bailinhaonella thermotolerans]|uniref:Recombinase-like domain-containing protein n=1 Tax=Bailinhaonella thermotolerans TaxID=1070861 RepID=A0A3A4A8U2_9ACTN|nr:recombinase-like helix-turn-helix domain-containing protein [Bailinhaonella thermotolerans]RJL24419.1 hypothetical protein D5H75_29225 [Bailinhaonella thermotolerans]